MTMILTRSAARFLMTAPLACAALAFAASPPAPSTKPPTSPAEVAEFLKRADAAEAWRKELIAQRGEAKNRLGQAMHQLRNGPFKTAGGFELADYKRLAAAAADLDAQMRAGREAALAAEKAGNKDERAAMDIENQRLRVRKDAAQAELDAFLVKRCLNAPAAKSAAEHVQSLQEEAAEAENRLQAWDAQMDRWSGLLGGYRERQKPAGFELTQICELTLPPPADAERRRAEFARRNDATNVEALAHRLFRALDENARGLERPFELYRENKYAAAIDAFRDYFFDKVANLEKYGVPADAVLTDERPPLGTPILRPDWVADAMRGVATQPNRFVSANELLKFSVGEPGAVNWAHLPFEPQTKQKMPVWLQIMRQFHLLERVSGDWTDGVRCWLMDAYQATGDAKYLRRWAEYADDWALNMQRDLNSLPVGNVAPAGYDPVAIRRDARGAPYCWNVRWYPTLIANQMPQFVTRLRALALTNPAAAQDFPSTTLARVLLTGLDEYVSPNILIARATRFNWNMMGMSFSVRCGMLLGEFKAAQWAGREAARVFQNHAMFSIMPDGGYVEYSDEGHQGVWQERANNSLRLWEQQRPAWFDNVFADEFRESITRNGEFFLRHLKPDGYRHRDDYRSAKPFFVGRRVSPFGPGSLDDAAPWVTEQPEPQRMLGTVFGEGSSEPPRHRSDVMPCLGEFMLRGGWGKDDPFFYMHSGRIPNSNADEDCNGFKLHAFGRHLLTAQPVYVDGRTQNQHFELVDNVGGKTCFLTHSDGLPIQGRWHTSACFDLAEGVYEGAYEDRPGRIYWSTFRTGGYDMQRQQRSLGLPAITDVRRHARQVFFVREPVAWIVVDRVQTAAKHDYEAPFEFYTPVDKVDWLRRKTSPIPNADQRIVIDQAAYCIRTDNPGWPRVALHCFSGSPLSLEFDPKSHDLAHKDGLEIRDAEREWKIGRPELRDQMAFTRRALVKWTGEGDQVMATLITTSPPDSKSGWQINGHKTAFSALAPDGTKIHFSAAAKPESLCAGRVAVEADSLLVVEPKQGPSRGIMLGPRSAEFAFDGQLATVREIHAPILPVTFGPNENAFVDNVDVTMACATPGATIRYTLDGSEPTLDSPCYEKPVRIAESAVVRAIAVRPGAGELRWPLDPGFASLPTRAVFTKQSAAPAVRLGKSTPGLAWQYAEGQMFALAASSEFIPAQKSGTTAKLFDVSMRTGGSAFVVRYEGYIDVPADGVYTLHAPREFILPDCDPGYDLRIFVDGHEWWPAMRWHALGTWSRALAKGPHKFRAIFVDTRTKPYKHETWQNWPNLDVLWKGAAPSLEISGPDVPKQPIPSEWLKH